MMLDTLACALALRRVRGCEVDGCWTLATAEIGDREI